MQYPTHMGFAVAPISVGAMVGIVEPAQFPILCAVSTFGAMLPDIDHPQSKIGRCVWPLAKLIEISLGHRGGTHSLLATITLSVMVWMVFGVSIALAFGTGYLSHLIADSFTKKGTPFLWPKKRYYGLKLIKTNRSFFGSIDEAPYFIGAWSLAIIPLFL